MPTKKVNPPTTEQQQKPMSPNNPHNPAPQTPPQTQAGQIWNEIKNLPINMFGLPAQTISAHCSPTPIEPSKLYLTIRSSAVLPALEVALGHRFTVQMVDRFIVVERSSANLFPPLPKKK